MKYLRDLASSTRKEKGCLYFVVHESEIDSELFTIYQAWEGEEFLEAHAKTPHARYFRTAAPELLEGPCCTPAGGSWIDLLGEESNG